MNVVFSASYFIRFIIAIVLLATISSCVQERRSEARIKTLMETKVAEEVEDFRKKQLASCRERILEKASRLADSIILERALTITIIDTLDRPIPPDRPVRPPIRSPKDTSPVAPFFLPDTLR